MNHPDNSDRSDKSDSSDPSHPLIPKHGGYRKLRSFLAASAVYDATVIFCDRFIEKRSRTHDQMVQAARSGVRNIEEGSVDSGTSKKSELKLTNIARGSLEELMGDYEDFLRHRRLPIWDKNSPKALAVRRVYLSDQADRSNLSDPYHIRTADAETAANTLLCLINQASYLLHRQLNRLEQDFLQYGGFTERVYTMRAQTKAAESGCTKSPTPACPLCGKPMRVCTARKGPHTGTQFWGCPAYPDCKGKRPV
ncbi:MAG TPA: four helix bundle suffix domain-containing protein [Candidatus Limnocylindrales bacterium]|nr:four helix bundle suffix domain-containing protein [Candidatus Limnocylindrales bacterium]